jgi:large subunit ribosomal protein L32
MAVPKRKTSKTRRDTRRATHAAAVPSVSECPQCHAPKLSHRICPNCGMYDGRQVVKVEE